MTAGKARTARALVALVTLLPAVCLAGCTATEPSSGSALPPGKPWKLVFADEFRGNSLNKRTWHTCFWWATTTCSITSNHELELYNRGDAFVRRGTLRLRAQRRRMVGWSGRRYRYTSGMVMTGGRKHVKPPGFTFTYGFAEARIRVPKGKGFWPAFWMLPARYESLPEIDIMEILGHSTDIHRMHFHYREPDGTEADSGAAWTGPDFAAGWHTFAVDWQPDAIVWYVDGVERRRFTNASVIPNEPMYLLLNLAVGGDWPGRPRAATRFPSYLQADYVRVWQRP
jgi:beta-glucanase (GH16 family)